jgi:hypothetical protein
MKTKYHFDLPRRTCWIIVVRLFLALLLTGPGVAHAIQCKQGGNWSNPTTWDPQVVPGPGDSVEIIDCGIFLDVAATVANLTLGGSGNGGSLEHHGGGSLTVTNRLEFSRGGIGGPVNLDIVIANSATLVFSGPSAAIKIIGGNTTIHNAGRIEWTGGAVYFNGTLNNAGTFAITGDAGFGHPLRTGVINNSGRIVKEGGSGITQFSGFTPETNSIATWLHNQGVVEVASGTIEMGRGTSVGGEFKVAEGKILLISDGHTFDEAKFTGPGTCSLASSMTFLGRINSTLDLELGGGGGIKGGDTTHPEAILEGSGRLIWKGGLISGNFTFSDEFRTILTGPDLKTYGDDGVISNRGTMDWFGPGALAGNTGTFINDGTFNVLAAGTFLADVGISRPTFENLGTLNTFGGGTSTTSDTLILNRGLVNIGGFNQAGILQVNSFTQTATATLYMEVGGANAATPQFDQLLGGFKTIDGTLRVEMINDFLPVKDARFTLIESQTGKFSRVLTPGVNRFAVEYPGNAKTDLVSLSDAPIPPKLWGAGRDLAKNESPDRAAETEAVNQSVPQWSYGYRAIAASTALSLFTPGQHINDASGLHGWIGPGQATLGVNTKNTPIVFNSGSGDLKPLHPAQIYMSPGSGNEVLVARWTAPAAGDYRVVAQWVDLDSHGGNGVFAYLLRNGQVEFTQEVESTATSTGKAKLRARTFSLNAGDHLDFAVESNSGDTTFDATAFNAAIRRIPEVNITSPTSGLQLSGGAQNVTVNVNVDDILPASKVTLTVDGAENVVTDSSAPFSLTTLLKPGYHRIVAVATDTGGAKVESPEIVVIVAPANAQQAAAARGIKGVPPQAPAQVPPSKLLFSSGSGSWHDPATWGNAGVPDRWDYAIIQPGHVVVMEFGIQVRDVTINGTLGRASAAVANPALDVYGTLHATGQIENVDLYINGPAGKFLIVGTSPVLRFVNIINQSRFIISADAFNGEGVTIENRGSIKAGPPQTSQERLQVSLTGLTQTAGKLTLNPNTVINAPPGVKLGGLVELSPGHVVSDAGAGLISDNGAVLIGLDGGTLIGLDGGTLIGLDGGTLIGLDGGTLVGADGAPLIGLDGGTLIGNAGGTIQPTSADSGAATTAADILLTGGTITGIGEVRGDVVNQNAFISPGNSAGGIVVNGSFTQEAGGTLVLELGGKTANPFTYDIFQVAGHANLGGNLVVKTINGFTPAAGETIPAFLYGSHSGNFDSISSNAQVDLGANRGQVTTSGPNPQGPRALNISTRLQIQSGDNALFAGFIITGPAGSTKKVLIRGIGPSLAQFGVHGTIPDPFLELHGSGAPITNDDWQQAPNANEIPNGFAPGNPKESIIIATLSPGSYSAILKGAHGETGVGLAEVYDLDPNSAAQLANIATRGLVQTGDNVLIGGFIIAGNQPAKVIVRAVGPSLAAFGLQGVLQDTTLSVHDANGGVISNDDWRETDEAAIAATTIPPSHDKEAAVLAILAPGSYTAVVRGADGTTGIAVVEAYNLQ